MPSPSSSVLSYEEHGSGIPVVLLHGFPLHRAMWKTQIKSLSQNCRLILPDFSGFGPHDSLRKPAPTIERMADDVSHLLDHLALPPAVIGGFSMGGYVALALIERHPERLHALMLLNTHPKEDPPGVKINRRRMMAIVKEKGIAPLTEELTSRLLTRATRAHSPTLVQEVIHMMQEIPSDTLIQAWKAMVRRPDRSYLLRQFKKPCLILTGTEDPITPPQTAHEIKALMPHATLSLIKGASHLVNLENPMAFNQAVIQFLKTLPLV